jgi:hypothetical protein
VTPVCLNPLTLYYAVGLRTSPNFSSDYKGLTLAKTSRSMLLGADLTASLTWAVFTFVHYHSPSLLSLCSKELGLYVFVTTFF